MQPHSETGVHDLRAKQYATRGAAMLGREEELRLVRAAQSGDDQAFDRLVRAHMPLVPRVRSVGTSLAARGRQWPHPSGVRPGA